MYTRHSGSDVPRSSRTADSAAQQASVRRPSDVSTDGGSLPDEAGLAGDFPWLYGYEVVRELPHQADAFTQGLEYDKRCAKTSAGDGFECTDIFWESTGALAWRCYGSVTSLAVACHLSGLAAQHCPRVIMAF